MVLIYVLAIVGAEASGVFINEVIGALSQTVSILILLSHYVLAEDSAHRDTLPALALLPLLRILSLTIPLRQVPQIYWYAMIGIPLLVATFLVIRLLGLSGTKLGLRPGPLLPQLLLAVHGLPLGIAAFLLFQPPPLVENMGWFEAAVAGLSLILFVAFSEELIFRGLLQHVLIESFGRAGLMLSAILFMATYLGSLSTGYVLFMGLVGLFFGWSAARTDSIWGVALAHAILKVGLLLVWPMAGG